MFRNVVVRFALFLVLVVNPVAQAAIISSFDADSTLTISADFDMVDLETYLDDDMLIIDGAASGATSGSGDDFFDLASGDSTTLSAFADGAVTGSPGSVFGEYLSSGGFFFENMGSSTFVGEITFAFELFASILTDSGDEFSIAYSSIVAGFDKADSSGALLLTDEIIIDEFIEFESDIDGLGPFSDAITGSFTSSFSLGTGESISYFFELDASGFTETSRAATVSEPITLAIFAMAMMGFGIRRFNFK